MRWLALIWMLLLAAPAVAQETGDEARDRTFLSGLIEDNLSTDGARVRIDGFAGALSSRATIRRLTIADRDGIWLIAEGLVLDWNRAALFGGELDVDRLAADRIAMLRAPLPDPSLPAPEARPFSLPTLPVSVRIGALDVARIELGAPLLGSDTVLSLTGQATLAGATGAARILAERIDGTEGRFAIDGGYSNATGILSLVADLSEGPDGIIARLLDLPGRPSLRLTLNGTGPVNDYAAQMALATDGQRRVSGTFGLLTRPDAESGMPANTFRLDVAGDITPLLPPQYADFFGNSARLALAGQRRADGRLILSSLDVATGAVILTGAAEIGAEGWPDRIRLDGVIGRDDGLPVLLPVGGAASLVNSASLSVDYDRAVSDDWAGQFSLIGLTLPGVTIPALTLTGGGSIRPAAGGAAGAFLAALDYAAQGMVFADPGLDAAIGPEAAGSLRLSRQDDGPVRIERLTLTGPGIAADVQGQIDGPANDFRTELSVMLTADDLARFSALAGLDLGGAANLLVAAAITPLDGGFEVVLSGETTDLALGLAQADPYLDGAGQVAAAFVRDAGGLRAEGVSITTADIVATGEALLTSGASSAGFDLAITDAGMALPGLSGPARLTGTADRDTLGATRIMAEAALPGVDAVFLADIATPEAGSVLTVQAEVIAADLSAFRDLTGLALSGAARLNGTGRHDPATAVTVLDLRGSTGDLALGLAQVDPLLAGSGRIAGRITLADGTVTLEAAEVATAALSLTGAARQDGAGLSAAFEAGLDNLGRFVADLPGPVRFAGEIAQGPDGVIALDLTGRLPAGQVALAGQVSADAARVFEGRATAALDDLAPLAALAGRPLGGALALVAEGRIAADLGLIDLAVTATTQDLRVGIAPADALLAGPGQVSLRLTGTGPDQLLAEAITIGTPILSASGRASLSGRAVTATLDATVTDLAPVLPGLSGPARLGGAAALSEAGTLRLDLTGSGPGGLRASLGADLDLAADQPAATGTADVGIGDLRPWGALAGQRLNGGASAVINGTWALDGSRFDLWLDARARDLDPGVPQLARVLAGEGRLSARLSRPEVGGLVVEGAALRFANLNADLDLTAAGSAGQADFDARLADVALFAPDFSGPLTAQGTARRGTDGQWTIDTGVTGPGGVTATFGGTATETGQLALRLAGSAPLALANGFIELVRVTGHAGFDLRIDGPAALRSVSGTIRIGEGRVSAPGLGGALRDLGGAITLGGGRAALDLGTQLDSGGQIDIGGSIDLTPPFAGDLRIGLAGLVLRDPALYATTADGALTVIGPLAGGARIAGTVELGPTELQVPSSGIGALGALPPVVHVNPSAAVLATLARAGLTASGDETAAAGGGWAAGYPLDLTIRAEDRVFIRGRGLDAELGGELRLGGTTANIVPVGQFSLIRGRLDILQQRFVLTEGSATLQGDFDPVLRLLARTQARTGTEIDIIIEGLATEPQVIFRSRPELPQDEVLAQLIFGRDLATITPLQAVQLAAAVGALAGRGGGGIIDGLRQGIGLDDFDIGQDAAGDTALRAGRYLGEYLYTDVTISQAETAIHLNLDLTEDVTATGTVSTTGETSIGIYLERDY